MKFKTAKRPIIALAIITFVLASCFLLDYWNVPSLLGIKVKAINLDIWSILISNAVVISIFIMTYMLYDRRNLEKDRLARYAGRALLLSEYYNCNSKLELIDKFLDFLLEKRESGIQISSFIDTSFNEREKVYESLANGSIDITRYDNYHDIQSRYDLMIQMLDSQDFPILNEIIQSLFVEIRVKVKKEIDELEAETKDMKANRK